MKLLVPTLNRDEEATLEGIAEVVPLIAGKEDPFAILEDTEQTYAQILWTPKGYDLEYQEQSVMNHFQIGNLLSEQEVVAVLKSYLNGDPNWKDGLEFSRKEIADMPTKTGFNLGQSVGSFIRGFRQAKEKKLKEQRND